MDTDNKDPRPPPVTDAPKEEQMDTAKAADPNPRPMHAMNGQRDRPAILPLPAPAAEGDRGIPADKEVARANAPPEELPRSGTIKTMVRELDRISPAIGDEETYHTGLSLPEADVVEMEEVVEGDEDPNGRTSFTLEHDEEELRSFEDMKSSELNLVAIQAKGALIRSDKDLMRSATERPFEAQLQKLEQMKKVAALVADLEMEKVRLLQERWKLSRELDAIKKQEADLRSRESDANQLRALAKAEADKHVQEAAQAKKLFVEYWNSGMGQIKSSLATVNDCIDEPALDKGVESFLGAWNQLVQAKRLYLQEVAKSQEVARRNKPLVTEIEQLRQGLAAIPERRRKIHVQINATDDMIDAVHKRLEDVQTGTPAKP